MCVVGGGFLGSVRMSSVACQQWLPQPTCRSSFSTSHDTRAAARCRLVSFLCDLTHWALEVQHARSFADDVVEHPSLQVRSSHSMRNAWHGTQAHAGSGQL